MERQKENIIETLSVLAIIECLKKVPDLSLEVIETISNRQLKLVLNRDGQLCYRDGINIKLVDPWAKLVLVGTMPVLPTAEKESVKVAGDWSAQDYRRIANGINALIEDLTSCKEPVNEGDDDNVEGIGNALKMLENHQTNFQVIVPPNYKTKDLALKYYRLIKDSIDTVYNDLIDMGKISFRITTEGYVRNFKKLKRKLAKLLHENGMEFEFIDPNKPYAYVKIRVWQEETYDQENDLDIPF